VLVGFLPKTHEATFSPKNGERILKLSGKFVVMYFIKLPALFVAFLLAGCATEWSSKLRTSSEVYPVVAADKVEILFALPARSYKQIGIVSVEGSTFSTDVDMLKKLRKAAGDLGADAVIVTGQYQGVVSAPITTTTVGSTNTVGFNTSFTATTFGTGGVFSYPKNQGIAIKYTN
jgi:hypothetical protein